MLHSSQRGFAPPIPGVSQTSGESPSSLGPMEMIATMMGMRQKPEATGDKLAQVIQLLREIAKEDPRIGLLTSEAMRVLMEGGASQLVPRTPVAGSPGPTASYLNQGVGGGTPPMGGPGGVIA